MFNDREPQPRICIDCGQRFTPIDINNPHEIRCTEHQIEFRKQQAEEMHESREFARYSRHGVAYERK